MIKIVCVGKLKEKYYKSGIEEYSKRLAPYTKIQIIEVEDISAPQNNSDAQNVRVKDEEGDRILSKIGEDEFVILLDLHGKEYTSEEIAKKLEEINTYQSSKVTFVIGGSLGLSEKVLKRSNMRWCLSKCTFPHQMVRFILLEQIYRCYKINNHEPYHK